jgi:hypothetical protein
MEVSLEKVRALSDEALLAETEAAVLHERLATTVLVARLVEVDARRLYRSLGFSCMRAYCTEKLQLSVSEAFTRIRAVRVVQRFPEALTYLADGSLTLSNITLLASHLTDSNATTLLHLARYKTTRELLERLKELNPDAPDVKTLVLRLPREAQDKLREAQDLLRHEIPDGNPVEIFTRALTLLVDTVRKKKRIDGLPRPDKTRQLRVNSRHVPHAVRKRVWSRDEGRCTFLGTLGRCAETGGLEFHHIVPFARGGGTTVENITLRCRAHNQYEAEQVFGAEKVATARARRARKVRETG